jgi:hypothetical protein
MQNIQKKVQNVFADSLEVTHPKQVRLLITASDQASISSLEGVARNFTSRITDMDCLDYWERLESLRMYSQERSRERYQIIFIWKLSQGLVTGYHLIPAKCGLLVSVPPVNYLGLYYVLNFLKS